MLSVKTLRHMPVEYRYNPNLRTIDVQCFGELVIEEIMRYFDGIRTDADIAQNAVELVDLSQLSHFNVDFKGAADMPGVYASAHEVKEIRATLLFGTNPLNKGLAELIKAHFHHTLLEHPFQVVGSKTEALSIAARIHEERDAGAC